MNKEKKTLLFMYVDNFCGFERESFNFDVQQRFCVKNSNTIVPASDGLEIFPTHFFGENVSALTLLIGENGAGKTTLFRLMSKWLCELAAGTYPKERGAFIIRIGKCNYLIAFQNGEEWVPIVKGTALKFVSRKDVQIILKDVSLVYYTDTMTDLELDELLPEDKREFLTDHSLITRLSGALNRSNYLENAKDTMKRAEFAHQMRLFLHLENTKDEFPIHFMKFSSVKIGTSKCFKHLRSLGEDGDDMKSLLENYGERIAPKEADSPAMLARCLLWCFLTGVISSILLWERRLFGMRKSQVLPFFQDAFLSNLRHLNQNADTSEAYTAIKDIFENLHQFVSAFDDSDVFFKNEFKKLWEQEFADNKLFDILDLLHKTEEHYLSESVAFKWQRSWSDDRIIYYISPNKLPRDRWEEFWLLYEKFYHMMPDCSFDWQYPSSGEKNYVNSMIPLINAQKETSTIWCLFDEPDNTLHPQWQRTMIQTMCGVCDKANKDFQIWISSHSPIMLSGVPKQAAIFLDARNKENKKKQVRSVRSSFAQQIYTLYDDAFLPRQGVIGTLAEQHLRTIYKKLLDLETRLNSKRKLGKDAISEAERALKEAKGIIDCLEEPLLKGYLQLMYKRCQQKLNIGEQNTNKS